MRRIIVTLSIVYWLLMGTALAGDKSAQVCNAAGQTVWVAFGWLDDLFPQSWGWAAIADGTCKRMNFPDADMLPPLYAYAIGQNGTEYRPTTGNRMNFCIKRGDVFKMSAAQCGALEKLTDTHIFQWESFAALPYESFQDHKWTIQ